MEVSIELITPEIAKEYLTHNTKNYRTLSMKTVKKYAEDMKNGMFAENGEAIQFSADGTMKNGQHRLNAIVLSGVSIRMVVVRGVDNDCDEYDWGKQRNIGDWGKANGMYIPHQISGTARILLFGFGEITSRGSIADYIKNNYAELHEAYSIATYGNSKSIGRRVGTVMAVFVCRRLGLVNDHIMRDFFSIFNTGTFPAEQLRDPSPALVASRQFLTKFPAGAGGDVTIKAQFEITMLALKDFNVNRNRRKEYPLSGTYAMDCLDKIRKTAKEAV